MDTKLQAIVWVTQYTASITKTMLPKKMVFQINTILQIESITDWDTPKQRNIQQSDDDQAKEKVFTTLKSFVQSEKHPQSISKPTGRDFVPDRRTPFDFTSE